MSIREDFIAYIIHTFGLESDETIMLISMVENTNIPFADIRAEYIKCLEALIYGK